MEKICIRIYNRILILALLAGTVLLAVGCKASDAEAKKEGSTAKVYYLSREGAGLEQEPYNHEKYGEPSVDGYINALSDIPSDADSKRILGGSVLIINYELVDDCLRINYNDEYMELDKVQEILFRASMVKTLCQLPEVSSVSFFVMDEPLCDLDKEPYRSFNENDFVDVD